MQRSFARRAVLLTAAIVAPLTASAQIEAGRVVDDSTMQPIAHAEVLLVTEANSIWKVVGHMSTDSAGLFQFGALHPGVYRLAFAGRNFRLYYGPLDTLTTDSYNQRQYAMPLTRPDTSRVYFEFQVPTPVRPWEGLTPPPYPEELVKAGIKGKVIAQWVVGADGRADISTLKLLNTPPHRAFGDAVYTYLLTARFHPAVVNGTPVRQVVQQEFDFSP